MNTNFIKVDFPFQEISDNISSYSGFTVNINKPHMSHDPTKPGNINAYFHQEEYIVDIRQIDNSKHDNCIIICINNNTELLSFCLDQIYANEIIDYSDILIIDDRPINNNNLQLSEQYRTLYCSVQNTSNSFNYSMLNNIASCIAMKLDKQDLVFWNSDLWPSNKDAFYNLLKKHRLYKSTITGTKLIYPPVETYQKIFKDYDHVLGPEFIKYCSTIQHGGIVWNKAPSQIYHKRNMYLPFHQWRFWPENYELASFDTRCLAVTGALHIVNTNDYIGLGGYHCALSTAFQDIELCQRAIEQDKSVYYIGSEKIYHAETITNNDGKNYGKSLASVSDALLYDLMWQPKMTNLLGLKL